MATGRVNKTNVDALTVAHGEAFLWDNDLHGFGIKSIASTAAFWIHWFGAVRRASFR